ncbi:unnamed protein product, partial [Prorocentrum cordatum]
MQSPLQRQCRIARCSTPASADHLLLSAPARWRGAAPSSPVCAAKRGGHRGDPRGLPRGFVEFVKASLAELAVEQMSDEMFGAAGIFASHVAQEDRDHLAGLWAAVSSAPVAEAERATDRSAERSRASAVADANDLADVRWLRLEDCQLAPPELPGPPPPLAEGEDEPPPECGTLEVHPRASTAPASLGATRPSPRAGAPLRPWPSTWPRRPHNHSHGLRLEDVCGRRWCSADAPGSDSAPPRVRQRLASARRMAEALRGPEAGGRPGAAGQAPRPAARAAWLAEEEPGPPAELRRGEEVALAPAPASAGPGKEAAAARPPHDRPRGRQRAPGTVGRWRRRRAAGGRRTR